MANGCRDCRTCTKAGLTRMGQDWVLASVYLCTVGLLFVVKRGVLRHCPQCKHLLSGHRRRIDGSFQD
ncbi:hypothetical protein [Streptomyces sp. NPDC051776]|uniref:hypothetical protein n=1 Tax=Streptomyces sp. NPDC051776 TaxID=3155414 RepID=UPI003420751E